MSGRNKKATARDLLAARDLAGVADWARATRGALRALFSLTYEADALIRWRAIEAVAPAAGAVVQQGPSQVRRFLRGLFWLMNDESGGLGWHAPEAIGEALRGCPDLLPEYAPLLPAFLVEEPFERGTHLALARLARRAPGVIREAETQLTSSLADPDAATRVFALEALTEGATGVDSGLLERLHADRAAFERYDFESGELTTSTVGEAARLITRPPG